MYDITSCVMTLWKKLSLKTIQYQTKQGLQLASPDTRFAPPFLPHPGEIKLALTFSEGLLQKVVFGLELHDEVAAVQILFVLLHGKQETGR